MQVEPLEDANITDDSSPSNPEDANATDSSSEESSADEVKSTFEIIQEELITDDAQDNEVEDLDLENASDLEEDLTSDEVEEDETSEEDTSEETVNTDESDSNIEDELPTEFHEHPRFKELVAQKNEAREQVKELEQRVVDSEAKANLYDAIGEENMNLYVDLLKAMDEDPTEALNILKPTINRLVQEAGLALSKDLQEKVDMGELTEDEAKERAKLEAENERLKRKTQKDAELSEAQKAQTANQMFLDTAMTWESKKREQDPDYKRVQKLFTNSVKAELQSGFPALKDTTAFLEKIYQDVKSQMLGTRPDKPAKNSVKGSPTPKGQQKRVYKDTFDIVRSML